MIADGPETHPAVPTPRGPQAPRLAFEVAVMDRVNAAVVATDLDGRLLYANPFAQNLYGWTDQPLVGSLAAELAGVRISDDVAAEIGAALQAGESWEGDFPFTRPDGSKLTVHVTDSGLYDDDGQLVGVVSLVVDVTEERRSVARLAQEARAQQFLLRVSEVLSSSVEYRECLTRLASIAVPDLADLCLIDVLIDGEIVRMATEHADAAAAAVLEQLRTRYAPDPNGEHPAALAIRTGRSAVAREMPDDFLRATTRDEDHYALVKQLNFTSYMCAPLSARGRALGALTLVSTHADRRYGAVDLELAEEVARRASLVIDNARLLHEQTRIARALQSALLPPSLPTINGLQLSACYRAAGEGNTVGGDFYDVFDLGRGAWAAVIGDVSGTGPEAAAITGLVRHALRASGLSDRDPASMLRTANTMLATHDKGTGERFCSACVAVIRMGTPVRIVLASAGHCPPVVLRAAGGAEVLTCEGGLLGISGELDIRSRRATLEPGDRLLLHTDGLTEARDQEGRFYGEERFAKALVAGASAAPEALVASLLADVEEFSTGEHTDDLAVLVLGPNQP